MRNVNFRKSVVLKRDVIPGVVCVPGLRMSFGGYLVGLDTEIVIEHSETPFNTFIYIHAHCGCVIGDGCRSTRSSAFDCGGGDLYTKDVQ